MKFRHIIQPIFLGLCLIFSLTASAETNQANKPSINKVEGTCANGKDRFVMTVHHQRFQDPKFGTMHLYVYEGPLGSGWIRSKVNQDQARAHVCKEAKNRWLPDDDTPIDE